MSCAGYWPSRCFVSLSLNVWTFSDVCEDRQILVCQNKRSSSFSCSKNKRKKKIKKKKTRGINNIDVFFSGIFWQNEWGWKVSLIVLLWHERIIFHSSCALLCLHVCGFCWSIKPHSEQRKNKTNMSIKIWRKTSRVIFHHLPTQTHNRVILSQIRAVSFKFNSKTTKVRFDPKKIWENILVALRLSILPFAVILFCKGHYNLFEQSAR